MADSPFITIKGLKKDYLGGKVQALRGVDFSVDEGEFVIIYGPSGCGKSTLLGLMAALDKPTAGTILVQGQNINSLKPAVACLYRRHEVGMVFQQYNLVSTLSALDNVALPLTLAGVSIGAARQRASYIIGIMGLSERKKHKSSQLSGGEQQRVAIGRALALNPNILLVDEPTGNLDDANSREVLRALQEVHSWGRTVVMVTHNAEFLKYADKVIEMRNGIIVEQKTNRATAGRPSGAMLEKIKNFVPAKLDGKMNFWGLWRFSLAHLYANRLRTFFASVGVALGVGAIVGLVSLGLGLQKVVSGQIASMNALTAVEAQKKETSINPFNDDTAAKMAKIPHVKMVSPSIIMAGKMTVGSTSTSIIATGIKAEASDFEGVKASQGDMSEMMITLAAAQNFGGTPEGLIGQKVTLTLLDPAIEDSKATLAELVVAAQGTTVESKITGLVDDDMVSAVYLPLDKMKSALKASEYTNIKLQADNRRHVTSIRQEVEKMGYGTKSVTDLIARIDRIFLAIQIILGAIGGIALVVSLLGIVNIMTISLIERTHEVGIMKAIGASNKDISRLFGAEAGLLGLIGGVFGVLTASLLGLGLNALLSYLMQLSGEDSLSPFSVSSSLMIGMVAISYVVARIAGWYPSHRAAKLSAMESLRYE